MSFRIMNYRPVVLMVLVLMVSSCNPKTEKPSKQIKEKNSGLHLNDGKKWVANNETDIGMHNLKGLLDNLSSSPHYGSLAQQMQLETQYIIRNCSMTGEEHDQLHLILHPILSSISVIKDAKNEENKNNNIVSIRKNLEDYFKHFKTK